MREGTNLLKKLKNGFSIVELAIIIPIISTIIIAMLSVLWSLVVTSNYERDQLNITHDRQIALSIIESDVALTSRYLATVDSGVDNPYSPSGGWSYKGTSDTNRSLILRAYATTQNPLSPARQPVFVNDSASCGNSVRYFNSVQRYNIIYFVKEGSLYRRRLVNSTELTCEPFQYQKTSCPTIAELGGTRNNLCGADDELLIRDVSEFSISYYTLRSSNLPVDAYDPAADPSLVTAATDIEVTLTITKKAAGKTLSTTSTQRMTKLNMDL